MTGMTEVTWISAPSGLLPMSLGPHRLTMEPPPQYGSAMVNITNRCNLSCQHCFVFRDGNPNDPDDEMSEADLLAELKRLRDRHGIRKMLWMGGEPMIRWRLLEKGLPLFERNTIATNGTVPLKDFGPELTYVVSLDGPRELNDAVRGEGVFERVLRNLSRLPEGFQPTLMVQCVLHRDNQDHLEELVKQLLPTRVEGVAFSFLVPRYGEVSSRAWASVEEREQAIDIVVELKQRYPGFIWNSSRSLELMRPATARMITDHCPLLQKILPLYLGHDGFETPFCCYGNDVDCNRCGGWAVFATAARMPGPWDEILPRAD